MFVFCSDFFGWQQVHSTWKIFFEIWNDKLDPEPGNLEPVNKIF